MKPLRVGLLGIGTVGSGTFEVLARNQEEIRRRGHPVVLADSRQAPSPASANDRRRALAIWLNEKEASTTHLVMAGLGSDEGHQVARVVKFAAHAVAAG